MSGRGRAGTLARRIGVVAVFILGQGGLNSHTAWRPILWRGKDRHWGTALVNGVRAWCRDLPAEQHSCIDGVIGVVGEVPSHHDALRCMVVAGSGNVLMKSSVTEQSS